MCLKYARVSSLAAISEKAKFPHISADIDDNCIEPIVIHFIHSFIMPT